MSGSRSASLAEAVVQATRLYRRAIRSAPLIVERYALSQGVADVKAAIRTQWKNNAAVEDAKAVDMLVFKGTMELDEAVAMWKQQAHVLKYLELSDVTNLAKTNVGNNALPVTSPLVKQVAKVPESDFLKRFYAGHEA